MRTPAARTREIVSLGPFSLAACELLFTREGTPVGPSTRAFYVLATLRSRPIEVIGKSDLMDQVWSGIAVEEDSHRFHNTNLRKVRGDGKNGADFITTASGRGYRFVASILRGEQRRLPKLAEAGFRLAYLPCRLLEMIEYDETSKISCIFARRALGHDCRLRRCRQDTQIEHRLTDAFAGAVLFVDLNMVSDPEPAALRNNPVDASALKQVFKRKRNSFVLM